MPERELPKMVWDPRAGKFVPLDTDGQRVQAEQRRILLGIIEARDIRDAARAEFLEAVETVRALVEEGIRYRITVTDLAAAAGISRMAVYKALPTIEEEEAALSEGVAS